MRVNASQTRQAQDAQSVARDEALALPMVQVYPMKVDRNAVFQPTLWRLHLHEFSLAAEARRLAVRIKLGEVLGGRVPSA